MLNIVGENSLLQQTVKRLDGFHPPVNPVRNSSGALNPALRGGTPYGAEPGIILKSNPAAEQRGIRTFHPKPKKANAWALSEALSGSH
jgi:hypothetical protein